MQANAFRRFWSAAFFHVCAGVCCPWTGALNAADTRSSLPSVKNTQDIAAELDRETNLQSQLDRSLAPMSAAVKQTTRGAHRIKQHFAAGTPEYQQAKELYTRVRQALAKVEGELTEAVRTVRPEDRGERAGRANRQVTTDLNDAVRKFDDFTQRLLPAPASEQPKGLPAQPAPAGEPTGQPTPPGLPIQSIQPEQYLQAQQAGVSADVVVQVCNLFVVHTVGLGAKSVDAIRQQMTAQIRSQAPMPSFEET